MDASSLAERLSDQLRQLCEVVGADSTAPLDLLADLLGPAGSRPLSEPPAWPSNIADDHTPVEFSIAYNENEPPALRILAEAQGSPPGVLANLSAAHRFMDRQGHRFNLSSSRYEAVRDIFASGQPRGDFALWHSLVFRSGRRPELKVYFNPEVQGTERSPALVAEAVRRLGLSRPYRAVLERGVRPGKLGRQDRLTFFSLDLHDGPQARVKLYLSHHDAEARDVARTAGAVDGVDEAVVERFCATAGGGPGPFRGRPMVSSHTFAGGVERPIGYSVYVPIRSYVADDAEARSRVLSLLARHGFDGAVLDRAIAAVSRRPLHEGVGLIAHVSLRLGRPRPGVTVYLSAEAYRTDPPRHRWGPPADAQRETSTPHIASRQP
ncbi:tryptophan dimethylallyltransferase family protein [Solwaraspora sp. WMMD1047]|uniref:tryptophan dimethylallyltransferase family protein n=1 Tax=Solwaraspora sp. WMMD1047 TaxID=3016102 RepID=UPI002415CFF0|nr:tryptophan dimethylallyltransferase family protein [Solwaraspora sp. WMMD1047]MDG4830798.1 tryptophan dimethylallyltransferase family protein [Solwaraspora sp. WMMD1047]